MGRSRGRHVLSVRGAGHGDPRRNKALETWDSGSGATCRLEACGGGPSVGEPTDRRELHKRDVEREG